MSLQADDVKGIAYLARMALDEQDIPQYAGDLSKILDMVDQLNAADVADIAPLANPMDATQRLRPDLVTEGNQREALQANAPEAEKGLFLVPKVIE